MLPLTEENSLFFKINKIIFLGFIRTLACNKYFLKYKGNQFGW